jgi:hypothetical protein
MPTSGKKKGNMLPSAPDMMPSAFTMLEPMLRPGAPASLEVSFGDCSLKLERSESNVRVLLEGATPTLPRPRGLVDYLALLAYHKGLRQIAVIDAGAKRIITLLDHGAVVDRMYRSDEGGPGIWSGVQLVDRLSNQRMAPILFDLAQSSDLARILQDTEVLLPLGEAPKLIALLEPWIQQPLARERASGEDEKKKPEASHGIRAWLVRAVRSAARRLPGVGSPPAPAPELTKSTGPDEGQVPMLPMVRTSERPLLTAGDLKRFVRAALLVEEAHVRSISADDPRYVYALQNFAGFPVSIPLLMPIFEDAPLTAFEATLEAESQPGGTDSVRLVLPALKDLEASSLEGLRALIAERTGAMVIYGEI